MQTLSVKERIIEAASRLFYFEGYNQTGINQIIEEANVAKSSMYQSFRSKEDIAITYLQGRHGAWMKKMDDFVSQRKDGKDRILGAFDFMEDWLKEVDFRGCGFQNIITDLPKEQDRIKDQVLLHKNEVKKWVFNNLNEVRDNRGANEALSGEIMVLIEGAIILSQIQKDAWPIESAKNACKKLLT